MKSPIVDIRSQMHGELIFKQNIPEALTELLLPEAHYSLASCPSGNILIQQIETDDFTLWHHTILLSQSDKFLIIAEKSVLSLNFCLQNSFILSLPLSTEPLEIAEGQYNVSYLPNLSLEAEFEPGKAHSFVTLTFSPAVLKKWPLIYPPLATFLDALGKNKEAFLFPANSYSTKSLRKILFSLLHFTCKDKDTQRLIQNAKAIELLVSIFEHPPVRLCPGESDYISREDAEKIYVAKDWLGQQVNRSVSLFELARRIGMNAHKLSVGFQKITGSTVFHYHRKIRMNKAIQLLRDTNRGLFDIGTDVGYSDGKTFSKEFKKAKGIPPLEYRRQIRSQQHAKN
ncbi:MAG TPA: AraC family transcriptional regulator [Puia sp.]|jgi:AraC-like DNA-binding protein|nr:AraC family transcriptional regulator [Puia sp.]